MCRCSSCEGECDNPRPCKNNRIIRHGLIKCKTCLGLWNRDKNASRNILHIVKNEIIDQNISDELKVQWYYIGIGSLYIDNPKFTQNALTLK